MAKGAGHRRAVAVALLVVAAVAAALFFLGFLEPSPEARARALADGTREARLMAQYQQAFAQAGQCTRARYRAALEETLAEENLGPDAASAVMARYDALEARLKACTPSLEASARLLRGTVYRVTYALAYPASCGDEERRAPVLWVDVDVVSGRAGVPSEAGFSDATYQQSRRLLERWGPCTGPYLASRYVA